MILHSRYVCVDSTRGKGRFVLSTLTFDLDLLLTFHVQSPTLRQHEDSCAERRRFSTHQIVFTRLAADTHIVCGSFNKRDSQNCFARRQMRSKSFELTCINSIAIQTNLQSTTLAPYIGPQASHKEQESTISGRGRPVTKWRPKPLSGGG